jgi:ParB-like chromosome segregation protein Spo0J
MANVTILETHKPGGRLNDRGQIELSCVEGEGAKKLEYPYITDLASGLVVVDHGCQAREQTDKKVVAEYADAMARGVLFPPIVVFHDGERFWLADGFHRFAAACSLSYEEVPAEVREGGIREAKLHAIGANASHGLRRTNADKRRAVMMLLEDEEWSGWSDHEIARKAGVDQKTVTNYRASLRKFLSDNNSQPTKRTRTDKHGNVSEIDVSRIGRGKRSDPKPGGLPERLGKPTDWELVADMSSRMSGSAQPEPSSNVVSLTDRLEPGSSFEEIEKEVEIEGALQELKDDLTETGGVDPDTMDKVSSRARAISGAIGDLVNWKVTPEEFWEHYSSWSSRLWILRDLPAAIDVLQTLRDTSHGFYEDAKRQQEIYFEELRNAEGVRGGDEGSGDPDLDHDEG